MEIASRVLRWVAGGVFVAAVPMLFISASLRLVVTNEPLYSAQFDRYYISEITGLPKAELMKGARGLIDYFYNSQDSFDVRVNLGGREVPLYNDREVRHLKDVKALLQGFDRLGVASLLYIGAFSAATLLWLERRNRRAGLRHLARLGRAGGWVSLGLLILVGGLSLVDFEQLFLQFHFISFSNDLWQLDPATDRLIQMFPEGFFLDATLLIAGLVGLEALLVIGLATLYRRVTAPRPAPLEITPTPEPIEIKPGS